MSSALLEVAFDGSEYLWRSLLTRRSRRPGGTTKRTLRPSGLKHSIDYLDRLHGYAALKPELALAVGSLRPFARSRSANARASFSRRLLRLSARLRSAKARAGFSRRLLRLSARLRSTKALASFSRRLLRLSTRLHSAKARASFSCPFLRLSARLHSAKARASFSRRLLR